MSVSRRGFIGRMFGALAGVAVAPKLLEAVTLPSPALVTPAAWSTMPPPELFSRAVITNEAIAKRTLELLRRDLGFVKARWVHVRNPQIGEEIYWRIPERFTVHDLVNVPPLQAIQATALSRHTEVVWDTQRGLDDARGDMHRFEMQTLEPTAEALAERVIRDLRGARELLTACPRPPSFGSDSDYVNAHDDEFALQAHHFYSPAELRWLTRVSMIYGVDRA